MTTRQEKPPRDPALEVRSVTQLYPGVRALTDVDFSLAAGEIVGLVGHNGAGKSTLTRILAGVERPVSGTLLVAGREVSFSSPSEALEAGIAVVPQQLNLVPVMSVEDNITLGVKGPRREVVARAAEVARTLGLSDNLNRRARDCGASVQRLVMIARALLRSPSVVLLDEPTAALHPSEVERVFAAVERLRSEGVSVAFISHRLEEVMNFCSRVVVLRQGAVVAERETNGMTKGELGELIAGRSLELPAMHESPADDIEPLLSVSGLAVPPLVSGFDLEVRPGEVVGLAGLVGAGMTEVLECLAGLRPKHLGIVQLAGAELTLRSRQASMKAGIAYIPDDRAHQSIIGNLTVATTATLVNDCEYRVHRYVPFIRNSRASAAVDQVLGLLDIRPRDVTDQRISTLSGGNQQKVLIARALMSDAALFVINEPTEGVDIAAKRDIHDRVRELAARGGSVVVASSEPDELAELCDRVVVMYEGRRAVELRGPSATKEAITKACLVGAP
ncbi:Ribose import ATP-binding protein RbsA [Rhodococcus fascians]|uniref:sugar ABC transporter ATP-binding protein n=1 Tax=Rhodococcoides fascians TaxID=1828 RepID=UPI001427AE15|nr:Ribose import ATP-binding protein RbsA [Rhodococcus fascians]